MKLLLEHEKASLKFNEDTKSIELVWKKKQDFETYKMMFNKGLEALKANRATGWLSDIRNQGIVGPENATWVQKEIVPKAVAAGLKKIAVVMDKDVFKEYYVNKIKNGSEANGIMQYFDTESAANAWLKA